MDVLGPDRDQLTIYGSNFQQVNLTPNGGVSSTVHGEHGEIITYVVVKEMGLDDDSRQSSLLCPKL